MKDSDATPDSTPTRPLTEGEAAAGRASIGRYQIQRVVGRGGMGVVVAAHDPELDRLVAVKILVDHSARADRLGIALRREAQALAKVSHPNVLSVYDAGVDGSPFLVMQLIDGETLGAHLERTKPTGPQILALFLQAARGLTAIHAAGLIHRDVKPSNILVDKAGVVHVADLGLARIGELAQGDGLTVGATSTHTNTIAGTPAYMAPEQFERKELTHACDQFSFCVALWEALFGKRPFRGDDEAELTKNLRAGALPEVRAEGITKQHIAALRRGLSADPAARFPSMAALATALDQRSRGPWLVVGGAILVATAAIGAVIVLGSSSSSPPEMPPSTARGSAPPRMPSLEITDAKRLTTTDACDEYPAFGPDGTVYYDLVVGPDNHLMSIAPGEREPRVLTTTRGWDFAPTPSPDGKRIAFLRKTEDVMATYVADLDNLAAARRTIPSRLRPAWSPDGTFVWAGTKDSLQRLDAATGAVDRTLALPSGVTPMAAIELPDQRVVVLTRQGSATTDGLAIFDSFDAKARWLIPGGDENPMDEVLTLSPGGDGVLVARYAVTSNVEIWHIPFDGSPGNVVSGGVIPARKRITIHGKRLVWSDCTEYLQLATLTQTATKATKFNDLSRNKWQDFSPNAVPGTDDLIILSYRSQTDEIWRMSKTGDRPRVIPFGKLELDRITLSHDGTWLVGANGDGLFAGPIDGSSEPIKLLPADGSEMNATFSRDNQTIYVELMDGKADRVAAIPRTGGERTWLLPTGSLAPTQSPTAELVAYLAADPHKAGHRTIMVFDTKTKTPRPLSKSLAPYPYRDLRISQDGMRLLAIRRDGGLVELDTLSGKTLRTFDMGSDLLFGATYAGDEIFVGRSTSAGDLWEAELR